jgi:predicted dehydrogenase
MIKPRIAIAGFGNIGGKHALAFAAAGNCEISSICDPDPAREELAKPFRVPFFTDLSQLLDTERPDGVVVSAHTQAHMEIATVCVQRGIPCLVEKPFAVSARDARDLLALADDNGVTLLTGHHRRHNRIVQQAKDIVSGGRIGRLVGVSAIWALRKHDSYFDTPWRTQPGAGPVLTNLIHDVDTLRYICGEISTITATSSSATRGHAVEDTASLTITFDNGALGSVLITDAGQSPWGWEVNSEENPDYPVTATNSTFFTGTEGALGFPRLELWTPADGAKAQWFEPLNKQSIPAPGPDPLVAQAEHFARVIAAGETPRVSGREGARTLACIEAVFESARSGASTRPDFDGL